MATFLGSPLNDILTGGAADDFIQGFGGNDTLSGGNGNDFIEGNGGNDRLRGQNGNDTLLGGRGNDRLEGGNDDDTLLGGNGDDRLDGGSGDDVMNGGNGEDTLLGQGGNDDMNGGADDDELDGGYGDDTMQGDGGNDNFNFTVRDTGDVILDFGDGDDVINLRALDAEDSTNGNQAFEFIGDNPFSGFEGELRFDPISGLLEGNTDGDLAAEFAVALPDPDALVIGPGGNLIL